MHGGQWHDKRCGVYCSRKSGEQRFSQKHAFLKADCVLLLAHVAKANLKPAVLPTVSSGRSQHAQRSRRDLRYGMRAYAGNVDIGYLRCVSPCFSGRKICHDEMFREHINSPFSAGVIHWCVPAF